MGSASTFRPTTPSGSRVATPGGRALEDVTRISRFRSPGSPSTACPLIGGPMPRGDGYVHVFLRDPDGYVTGLLEHAGADRSDARLRAPIRD